MKPQPMPSKPTSGPSRKARLESLLHREVATTVQQELRDPRLGFITILRVELTADLQQATAFWTLLGPQSGRRMAQAALDQASGFVRRRFAPVVKTRRLPELRFLYDDAEEKRQGMAELIRQARSTDSDRGERAEPPAPETPPQP